MMKKYRYFLHYQYDKIYWWSVARRDLVWQMIKRLSLKGKNKKILEVGMGSGETLKFFKDKKFQTFGIDKSKKAIQASQGKADYLKLGRAEDIPFPDNYFDFVLALDVLEHIKKESKALKEMFRVLKPSGYFFVIVPAYNFLWSSRDDRLKHKRRYTKDILRQKLEMAGFKINKISYGNFFYFLPVAGWILGKKIFSNKVEIKGDTFLLPQPLNWLMIQLLKIENRLLLFANLPWGVSVLGIANKEKR